MSTQLSKSIAFFQNKISEKLQLFVDETWRVWTDDAFNREKENRLVKCDAFSFGPSLYQKGALTHDGQLIINKFNVAMLMMAEAPEIVADSPLERLMARGQVCDKPTHLAVFVDFDTFEKVVGTVLFGLDEKGEPMTPSAHNKALKLMWQMLRNVETIACWEDLRRNGRTGEQFRAWPKEMKPIREGRLNGPFELQEIDASRVGAHNRYSRNWQANPHKVEAHHIDDGIFADDEKKASIREFNRNSRHLASLRD
jgi:hypothetical protein